MHISTEVDVSHPLRILQVQQLPHAATSGERSGVLYDVRRLLVTRQEQANANPEDQINQGQVVALKKVRLEYFNLHSSNLSIRLTTAFSP